MKSSEVLIGWARRVGHRLEETRDSLGFEVLYRCVVCERVFYIWTRKLGSDAIMTDGVILGYAGDEIPLETIKQYLCSRMDLMK